MALVSEAVKVLGSERVETVYDTVVGVGRLMESISAEVKSCWTLYTALSPSCTDKCCWSCQVTSTSALMLCIVEICGRPLAPARLCHLRPNHHYASFLPAYIHSPLYM
jgi:hypothetical protein